MNVYVFYAKCISVYAVLLHEEIVMIYMCAYVHMYIFLPVNQSMHNASCYKYICIYIHIYVIIMFLIIYIIHTNIFPSLMRECSSPIYSNSCPLFFSLTTLPNLYITSLALFTTNAPSLKLFLIFPLHIYLSSMDL